MVNQFSFGSFAQKTAISSVSSKPLSVIIGFWMTRSEAENFQWDILSVSDNAVLHRYAREFQLEAVIITGDLGVHAIGFSLPRSAERLNNLSTVLIGDNSLGEFSFRTTEFCR